MSQKKILIVDDHEPLRRLLGTWLATTFPRHRILEATNGEEAIAMIQADPPRAVVMDIHLPGMNGIAATQRIKAAWPDTQVVILTIYEDDIHRADAMAAGASAFVSKRTMADELVPALAVALSFQDGELALRASEQASEEDALAQGCM